MKRLRLLATTAACRSWSSRLVATSVLASFTTTLLAPSLAFARDDDPVAADAPAAVDNTAPLAGKTPVAPSVTAVAPSPVGQAAAPMPSAVDNRSAADLVNGKLVPNVDLAAAPPDIKDKLPAPAAPSQPLDLPSGASKTGVSSQAISMPQGSGKIEGMGESFSAQLSTGIASFGVPFKLFAARGAAEPSLALSYSSSAGHGTAGVGWEMPVPFIARQTDRGLPKYDDRDKWHPEQDHFVFGGGQELVPLCTVVSTDSCLEPDGTEQGKLEDERMPDWAGGWQYFRSRVEGSFQRFFWSKDHRTWRVQDKSGVMLELGAPVGGPADTSGLEIEPGKPSHVFRWNLIRQFDAQGGPTAPVNQVVYRYRQDGGMAYLSDIYATPPIASPATAPLSSYAHHAHVRWTDRPDPSFSFRRGYRTDTTLRLLGVDVASKNWFNIGHRELTRRYHLKYDGSYHVSLLDTVQMEGRCEDPIVENDAEELPSTSCPTLPAMTFGYQHVEGFTPQGTATQEHLDGYEPFDARLKTMAASPPHSLDEELTDLFDVNADGLPDVVSTAVGVYGGKHGLFLNSASNGIADSFGSDTMAVKGVLGADAGVITLKNQNLSVQDLDGDGTIDFLHMPKVKTYSVYTPTLIGKSYVWVGREINTPKGQAPTIDFGKDADRVRVLDVNGDGLVDVMRITGTEVQTYFALGRYPAGDAVFGQGTMLSGTTASLSQTAVTSCVPWSGGPVGLEDKQITLGDMNGDGLQDIVRIRKGDIQYWPGRGNGMFGTGDPSTCTGGTFGQNRHIEMENAPQELSPTEDGFRLDDVNGDGLTDLLQVRFDAIDIWLNVDGVRWTPKRFILDKTPVTLPFASRFRVVDINGSGTRDLLWGNAEKFQYMDLAGAKQPWLLTSVANGLGKTTELTYQSSVELMLAAAKAGKPWTSTTPNPMRVVTKKVDRDHLEVVGRPAGVYTTEYTYRNPSYDGRQREFRGFEEATVRTVGDANSPTSLVRSRFLLGTCRDDVSGDGVDPCAVSERWRDNGREALKGLPATEDTFDETGKYLSTSHHQYTRRALYQGLDGRSVQHAFESQRDNWAYDLSPFTPSASTVEIADVVGDPAVKVALASSAGRVRTQSTVTVDVFGNRNTSVAKGCIEGCTAADEIITSTTIASRRSDDPTGWMWRTIDSYVSGNVHTEQRKRSLVTYDLAGNPVTTSMVVSGAVALQRYREADEIPIASGPTNGTVDGTVLLSTSYYDTFGNPLVNVSAGNRCTEITYEDQYAAHPTFEYVLAGTVGAVAMATGTFDCGTTAIIYRAPVWDRGLGVMRVSASPTGETSEVAYDGFGRLSRIYGPSESSPGSPHPEPKVIVSYSLPDDATKQPFALMRTLTQDGPSYYETATFREAYAYVDGLGRTLVTLQEADPTAEDAGDWVVNGLADWDTKGAARRAYLAWYHTGDPTEFPLATAPATLYGRQRYDAFGRAVQLFGLDGTVTLQSKFHALSTDAWDAADLSPGPHQGTYASSRKDGHGRAVETTERVHGSSGIEAHHVRMAYLPSGAVTSITRVNGADSVKRWMRYDTQDRMVLNVDAHTTVDFTNDETVTPAKTWRYAYSDAGDLVGTSDARGCGQTFFYDAAGRMLAEDYSPCAPHHPNHTPVDLETGDGAEVFYHYDTYEDDADLVEAANPDCLLDPERTVGRLLSVSDRASKTWSVYDALGRVRCIGKRLAPPGTAATVLADRYTGRVYTQTSTFDAADRPVTVTTGVRSSELLGIDGGSEVTTTYAGSGAVKSVGGSYGDLVTSVRRAADGPIESIAYGDFAGTRTDFTHDDRRRVATVQTYRGPPPSWSGGVATQQLLLQDLTYAYDEVDNPTEIRDWRIADEWPTGAKPVSRTMEYDDLYRVKRVDYRHHGVTGGGSDGWVDPHAADNAGPADARRQTPAPHGAFDKRMQSERFVYDWLGNRVGHDDDTHAFWDRSAGSKEQGSLRRYMSIVASHGGSRWGVAYPIYDSTGNTRQIDIVRAGPCEGGGSACERTSYYYRWDEVNRLQEAFRFDGSGFVFGAHQFYAYDAGDNRVRKTNADEPGAGISHSLYIFPSLELRGATVVSGDYELTARTEVGYLFGHGVRLARLHFEDDMAVASIAHEALHVLMELPDHLGSTSLVVDRNSGELVEAGSYTASGAAESDFRPDRWKNFREDYRFTGKEDDLEVGLTYFGKRYLIPALGTWANPDPLAVHAPGQADLNLYAYVHGRLLSAVDPTGLASDAPDPNAEKVGKIVDDAVNAHPAGGGGVCGGENQNASCGPTAGEFITANSSNILNQTATDGAIVKAKVESAERNGRIERDQPLPHPVVDPGDVAAGMAPGAGKAAAAVGARVITRVAWKAMGRGAATTVAEGGAATLEREVGAVLGGATLSSEREALTSVLASRAKAAGGFLEEGVPVILDENLQKMGVAEALREQGHNVRSVGEIFAGQKKITDDVIQAYAKQIGARVLTKDRGRVLGEGFGKLAIKVPAKAPTDATVLDQLLKVNLPK